MATNQNDYHYWEGSFKGLLPKEILELSDEDFQILYKDFEYEGLDTEYLENLIEDVEYEENEDSSYIEGKVLKQIFKDFLYEVDSNYFRHSPIKEEIKLFRSLSVNKIEEIDFDDKGICWTYDSDNIRHIEQILVPHNKYLTRFYGTTPIDNIDWIESLFLYINFGAQEKELRVYDSQKVFLKGYMNINYSTMIEYSKGGETSYLLDGVITQENLLKKRKLLFKSYNPQTNRYDYDGDLDNTILSTLISEDKDGFTINFGKVTGYFNCSDLGLTSLKGAPTEVGKWFNCFYNQLTSLEGAPQKVGGDFWCDRNQLTSLEGAPQKVGGNFWCASNQLTSLEGAPQEVGGDFWCYDNQLTSLKGAPQKVGKNFKCNNNQLTSLEGAPQKVGEDFICSKNQLTSLKGAPQEVGMNFDCSNNRLTSLEGAPQIVGVDFWCRNNPNLHSLDGIGEVKGEIRQDF